MLSYYGECLRALTHGGMKPHLSDLLMEDGKPAEREEDPRSDREIAQSIAAGLAAILETEAEA